MTNVQGELAVSPGCKDRKSPCPVGLIIELGLMEQLLGSRMKCVSRGIWSDQGLDIGWCKVMKSLINKYKDLKQYALLDWEPVEFGEDGGDVGIFRTLSGESSSSIKDTLDLGNLVVRQSHKDRIAVVQARSD